jgi:hypothetical protein
VIETGVGPSAAIFVNAPISATGRVTIEADGDLFIDADIYGTQVVLEAVGLIDQDAGTISGYSLEVEALNGVDLESVAVNEAQILNTVTGDVSVVDEGDLTLADLNGNGYAIRNDGGAVSVTTEGDLTIASDLEASGDVDLTAGTAGSGAIVQTAGLLSGDDLTASATSGILLGQTDVDTLTADTSSTGDILVSNLGDLTVLLVTAADGDVTLRATFGGSMSIDEVVALGHVITIEADGTVEEEGVDVGSGGAPEDPNELRSLEAFVTAGLGIGTLATIEIDVVRATLEVTGPGLIDVNDTAGGLDLISAVAPEGLVRINSAGGPLIARLVVAGGAGNDAFVTTSGPGDILLGLVQAADQATITSANGSIFDGNDVNGAALNVQTGGDAFMNAAVVIGTLANCIEIQIGGNLTLSAGGSIGGTSISLCGTTGGANPVIVIGAPGLSTVDGLEFLPLLQSARAAMNDLLDIRRRYDPILQRVLGDTTIWPPEVVDTTKPFDPTEEKKEEPKLPGESAEKKE